VLKQMIMDGTDVAKREGFLGAMDLELKDPSGAKLFAAMTVAEVAQRRRETTGEAVGSLTLTWFCKDRREDELQAQQAFAGSRPDARLVEAQFGGAEDPCLLFRDDELVAR
jgi:hypothetical protein